MNEATTTIDRIKKTSRLLVVFFKLAKIACKIGIGVFAVGVALCFKIPLVFRHGKPVLYSPFSLYDLTGIEEKQLVLMLSAGITVLILLTFLFRLAISIFKDISMDETPFQMKQVARIKKIAILYFVISLMDFGVKQISFTFTLNLIGILGGLMLWGIALIFEYGCELQKESDETL